MDDATDKYARLVRELVTPKSWDWILNCPWQEFSQTYKDKAVAAGIQRYDELFTAGRSPQVAERGAHDAIIKKARALEKVHRRNLDRVAPKIRAKIDELIEGKPDSFELGYQVADALKALGYSWEQVKCAENYGGGISAGLQIRYTGYYD